MLQRCNWKSQSLDECIDFGNFLYKYICLLLAIVSSNDLGVCLFKVKSVSKVQIKIKIVFHSSKMFQSNEQC